MRFWPSTTTMLQECRSIAWTRVDQKLTWYWLKTLHLNSLLWKTSGKWYHGNLRAAHECLPQEVRALWTMYRPPWSLNNPLIRPYFFRVPLDFHDDIKDAPQCDMEPKSNEHRKNQKNPKRAPKQQQEEYQSFFSWAKPTSQLEKK